MHLPQEATPTPEARTRELGREIFARAKKAKPGEGWLDRRIMAIGMRDERVKAQLFRLVDVLPVLRTPQQVNRHLVEYLGEARDQLPWVAQEAIRWWGIPTNGLLGKALAGATLAGTRRMARRFIAAADIDEALTATRNLRERGLTFTVDVLGEAVLAASEALAYQRFYLGLISRLADASQNWPENPLLDRDHLGPMPKVNVSVKLSSLFSQFDPIDPHGTSVAVRNRLRPILRLARERGVFINVDMEQYAYKDLTLRIFREILDEDEFRAWGDVGIAIQAYLRDCGEDLQSLADWAEERGTGVWVRLVKGAYWDYETIIARQNGWPSPVWSHKPETDDNYERQTDLLMRRHDVLRPAIASHNIRSIAHALALAEDYKVPARAIEFQLLYGMADPIKQALIGMNQRVRVYAPVGQLLPGMAYLVRRLLENTSNESFLRAGFLENVPEEKLLMNPMEILKRRPRTTTMPANGRPASDLSKSFENEPPTDFSREESRGAMRLALDEVRQRLGRSCPLVIDGKRIETGHWITSIDPSERSRIIGKAAAAKPEHALSAIDAAKRAFPVWRNSPPEARARMLLRAADIMRHRRFELAAIQVFECAKPWREADGDVAEAIDFCEYYAREMLRLSRPFGKNLPGESNDNYYEPRGVAVIIAPWNFPLAILTGMTAAALVAGNTAIMKPAEQSPIIAARLMEILEEAGFPHGVVNYLPGVGEEIGPTLVNHPDVAIIAFTGSRSVGLLLQQQAASTPPGQTHVKRVITEMGGKNAIIIDEDADLDEAVHGVAASAFGYAGQKCSACSRATVLASVHDTFISRLIEATASLKVGPAEDPATTIPPVIDQEAHQRILQSIERAKTEGLHLAYPTQDSGLSTQDSGSFIPPHLFTQVPPTSFLAQEEIFGPVLAILRAQDLDQAIDIANNTPYALTGGLYSRSPAAIERVRREFRVGNLYINRRCTGALVERQPFGGFKLSGIGSKAGGPDYLQQFLWPRTITENTMRRGFAPVEDAAQDSGQGGI